MTFNETNIQRDTIGRFSEKQGSAAEISLSESLRAVDGDRPQAPELSLGGPYEPELIVPLTVNWTERNVIPPRARKPRDIERTIDLEATVSILGDDDAPVAISFNGDQFTPGEYRVHNGELYVKSKTSADDIKSMFEGGWRGPYSDEGTPAGVAMDIQTRANQLFVLGDEVWTKAEEPVYAVSTYGMGGNHGSTALGIESVSRYKTPDGRPVNDWVFPLDQREEAVQKALEVARDRGDDQSFERIRNVPAVELSGDFKPGSTFTQAPRINYQSVYDLGWQATPEEVEAGFTEFKQQLLTVPGAVRDVPDGWGGMTKRVDLSKLTETQASHYQDYVKRVEGFDAR
jgi:hypothetical protein